MLYSILWYPKRLLLAHYGLLLHLTTPRRRLADAEIRYSRFRQWLFGKKKP